MTYHAEQLSGARGRDPSRAGRDRCCSKWFIRALPVPPVPAVSVVGVEELTFCRCHRYGTMLVDMHTHQVVDVGDCGQYLDRACRGEPKPAGQPPGCRPSRYRRISSGKCLPMPGQPAPATPARARHMRSGYAVPRPPDGRVNRNSRAPAGWSFRYRTGRRRLPPAAGPRAMDRSWLCPVEPHPPVLRCGSCQPARRSWCRH